MGQSRRLIEIIAYSHCHCESNYTLYIFTTQNLIKFRKTTIDFRTNWKIIKKTLISTTTKKIYIWIITFITKETNKKTILTLKPILNKDKNQNHCSILKSHIFAKRTFQNWDLSKDPSSKLFRRLLNHKTSTIWKSFEKEIESIRVGGKRQRSQNQTKTKSGGAIDDQWQKLVIWMRFWIFRKTDRWKVLVSYNKIRYENAKKFEWNSRKRGRRSNVINMNGSETLLRYETLNKIPIKRLNNPSYNKNWVSNKKNRNENGDLNILNMHVVQTRCYNI